MVPPAGAIWRDTTAARRRAMSKRRDKKPGSSAIPVGSFAVNGAASTPGCRRFAAWRRSGSAARRQRFGNHLPGAPPKKASFYADFSRCARMHADKNRLNELSGNIIGCAFTVRNTLGVGFPEHVHENALVHDSRKRRYAVAQQHGATVVYGGAMIGQYFVDRSVEDTPRSSCRPSKHWTTRIVLNASTISRQPACLSADCRTSPGDVRKSSALPTTWDAFRSICVHPLKSASKPAFLSSCRLARSHGHCVRRAADAERSNRSMTAPAHATAPTGQAVPRSAWWRRAARCSSVVANPDPVRPGRTGSGKDRHQHPPTPPTKQQIAL